MQIEKALMMNNGHSVHVAQTVSLRLSDHNVAQTVSLRLSDHNVA